jgi:hypothetical protein
MHDAGNVLEYLNAYDQDVTVNELTASQYQKVLEEAEEAESQPKKMNTTVLNLTEGLGLTEGRIKAF